MGKELEAEFYGYDGDALFADGFEDALIGLGTQFSNDVAIYDYEKCIEILVADGASYDEAVEFLEFNTCGAWVGEHTPVFLRQRAGEQA